MPSGVYKHSKHTDEHKENISKGLSNSDVVHSGQFKPGRTPWNKTNYGVLTYKQLNHNVRTSKKWVKWREKVFRRDNYTCQNCGERGITLHPHHVVGVKKCIIIEQIKLIYDVNNGITLCFDCHWDEHRNKKIESNTDSEDD